MIQDKLDVKVEVVQGDRGTSLPVGLSGTKAVWRHSHETIPKGLTGTNRTISAVAFLELILMRESEGDHGRVISAVVANVKTHQAPMLRLCSAFYYTELWLSNNSQPTSYGEL